MGPWYTVETVENGDDIYVFNAAWIPEKLENMIFYNIGVIHLDL